MSIPMNLEDALSRLSARLANRPVREPGHTYCPFCGTLADYPTDPTTHACLYCQQLLDHDIPLDLIRDAT